MQIPIGYQEVILTPKSARQVEAVWSFTAHECGQSIVLPDGRCDIILRDNIHKSDAPVPVVTGPGTQAYTVKYVAGDRWRGVRMRPDYGVLLWQESISVAANAVLRGDAAIRVLPALAQLDEQHATMRNFETAISTILGTNIKTNASRILSCALDAVHMSGGRMKVGDLAEFSGCTPRHLSRIFRSSVGIATKTYGQLVQFHRSLKLLQNEKLSIAAVAYEGGYADHAHLTRAFKRFGGFPPTKIPFDLTRPTLFP